MYSASNGGLPIHTSKSEGEVVCLSVSHTGCHGYGRSLEDISPLKHALRLNKQFSIGHTQTQKPQMTNTP
jgi:hypothetical protein